MLSSVARLFYTPTLPPPTIVETSPDFHFCRILPGDKFSLSLERHLHYLCGALHLKPGQRVLNIGSGTGDVAVELVRFADVTVVGMESNPVKVCRQRHWMDAHMTYHHLRSSLRGGAFKRRSYRTRYHLFSVRPMLECYFHNNQCTYVSCRI